MKTGSEYSWEQIKEEMTHILVMVCNVGYRKRVALSKQEYLWAAFCLTIDYTAPFGLDVSAVERKQWLEQYRLEVNVYAVTAQRYRELRKEETEHGN